MDFIRSIELFGVIIIIVVVVIIIISSSSNSINFLLSEAMIEYNNQTQSLGIGLGCGRKLFDG